MQQKQTFSARTLTLSIAAAELGRAIFGAGQTGSVRAVLLNNDFTRLMVTLKMEVVYKHNTPTHTPLKAVGRIIKDSGSRALVEGEILLPDGTVSAKCTSILYKIPQAVKEKWGAEEEEWARTTPRAEE